MLGFLCIQASDEDGIILIFILLAKIHTALSSKPLPLTQKTTFFLLFFNKMSTIVLSNSSKDSELS